MKCFIKDFFSKCDQIRILLQIWSHFLSKFLIEKFFFFSAVNGSNFKMTALVKQKLISSTYSVLHGFMSLITELPTI